MDAALFADLYPELRRIAAVAGPVEVEPDDLVQDALTGLLAGPGSLLGVAKPRAYLRRAVLNVAANAHRSAARRRAALVRALPDPASEPSYPSDLEVLLALPPLDRTVVFLVDVEGWPTADVADALDVTPNAVRLRVSRARRTLADLVVRSDDV